MLTELDELHHPMAVSASPAWQYDRCNIATKLSRVDYAKELSQRHENILLASRARKHEGFHYTITGLKADFVQPQSRVKTAVGQGVPPSTLRSLDLKHTAADAPQPSTWSPAPHIWTINAFMHGHL